ncbi:MAG: alpha/beta hydrolase [Actinomycetota bacterium]
MTVHLEFGVPGSRDARLRTAWTPGREPIAGWVWLQHGFARSAGPLGGLADALAARGMSVVRPDIASLTPRRSMHDPAFLTAVALTLANAIDAGIPQERGIAVGQGWVGIGHSAGAAVIVHGAAVLAARPGLPGSPAGLVLLDPVDTVGGVLARALAGVPAAVRIIALACPPSRCNRRGRTARWLGATGRAEVVPMPGVSHGDPERIPGSLVAADVAPAGRAIRWACGPAGSPQSVAELGEETVRAARSFL